MRNVLLFSIFVSVFMFFQCKTVNTNKVDDEDCERMAIKVSELINDYFLIDNEQSYFRLDSALVLIETMFLYDCNPYKFNLVTRKILTLSLKNDFEKALDFIRETNDSLFLAPYLKSIYLKRVKAMQAQVQGDMSLRNKLIYDIVVELRNYLSIPSAKIDSILAQKDIQDIFKYEKHIAICQYYFYRAQIEGVDNILNELDSLQQSINGNQEFFDDFLRIFILADFMFFDGL